MRVRIVFEWVLAASLLGVVPAVADDAGSPRQEGKYGGVRPGVVPSGDKGRRVPADTLGWVGFAEKERGAEVFLQAGSPFEISQRMEGSTLVVHLAGLRRQVRLTKRAIDVRFFESPLARITAKVVGGKRKKGGGSGAGIEVRITFKSSQDAREATVRTATESDGLNYAYLSFSPGTQTEAPEARPASDADVE